MSTTSSRQPDIPNASTPSQHSVKAGEHKARVAAARDAQAQSSTSVIPTTELKERTLAAAQHCQAQSSSTSAIPSGELEALLAAVEDARAHLNHGTQSERDDSASNLDAHVDNHVEEITHGYPLSARLADMSLTTRAFVSSPDGLHHGQVGQSSREAWFSLWWKQDVFCRFYYDPSGDGLVLKNMGSVDLQVRAADTQDDGQPQCLGPFEACLISPGPWEISPDDEEWVHIIVFDRRYATEKSAAPAQAGLKRTNDSVVARQPKRRADVLSANDGGGRHGLISVSHPSFDEETALVTAGHPFLHLNPGQTIAIRSPAEGPPDADTASQQLSENYSVTHLRNIVANKDACLVFRARHSVFGSTAVKVIRSLKRAPVASIPQIAQIWQNERRLMRQLEHPSIIKMFGSDARLYSIYMEYLPYPDLAKWPHCRGGHYFYGGTDDALRITTAMASALAYLEKEGIIHNDIKPSNILYDKVKGPILIDFGLACSFPTDEVCLGGTPWYVPLEVFEEGVRGFASDVFALGVTLLYVLRKIPLPDATERAWPLWSAARDTPQGELKDLWLAKVGELRRGLAKTGIEAIVGRMLAVKPKDRMPAWEIVDRLE